MRLLVAVLIAGLVGACSSTGQDDYDARAVWIDQAMSHPVDSARYTRIRTWKSIDNRHLLVTIDPERRAFLLELSGVCRDLDSSLKIGIKTRSSHRIDRGDKIVTRRSSCLITRISRVPESLVEELP